ncbi:MAG: hypothetical protein U1F27_07855 [Turneriella sp.]
MRKLNWRILQSIINPGYELSADAGRINKRWLYRQAFVLSLGSSFLTLLFFPLYHYLTLRAGETIFAGHPHRIAVIAIAALSAFIPLFSKTLRKHVEYFSFANLVMLFLCIAIDISFSERQRRYSTIGLVPLFGSTFVFTNIRVMTTAYVASGLLFNAISIYRDRAVEIIVIYSIAYSIAWWMAMIRIRSLHRISFDQARMYDRRVYDQRVRLARNLHDSLGGDLIQLSLQLKGSTSREEMLDLAQEILAKTRNLVYTLEPGNANENFAGFIRSYVERLKHTGKFKLTMHLDPLWPVIRVDQSLNLQAIFTEWMTNMIRHSQATEITITLRRRAKDFALAVSDNGRGFRWNGSRAGSGLRNIALRAGLMNARVFVRRRHADHGAIFYLRGRLLDD